jgi:hypothetical protein
MVKIWAWGLGALAAVGGYFVYSGYRAQAGAPSYEGGQVIPGYHFGTVLDQKIDGSKDGYGTIPYNIDSLVGGQGVSFIDGSFFGQGPLSLWTAGPMDYSDTFGGGHGRRRGRNGGHEWGSVGDDFPAGAGGYGYHSWHGPGFPPAPAGGEGFDNAGQGMLGGFGGGPAHTGGMPWPQQSQVGTQGQQYQVQRGDTFASIASKFWGKGADPTPLQQANSGASRGGSTSGRLTAGLTLTIPGAPQGGPPSPGGPSGNGVGGGSIGAGGYNPGVGVAPPGLTDGTNGSPGMGTSNAGASGGGAPNQGNNSRARGANLSGSLAVSGANGGSGPGVRKNNSQTTTKAPPTKGRRR